MADIRIEKKNNANNNPIWPWILGLLILVLLGWGLFEAFDKDKNLENDVAVSTQTERVPSPAVNNQKENNSIQDTGRMTSVDEFIALTNSQREMDIDHKFTSRGLKELADALETVAEKKDIKDDAIENDLEKLRGTAANIEKDPESLSHADSVSVAFEDAANAFDKIKAKGFPNTQVDANISSIRQSAEKVKGSDQLLDQKREVKNFFDQSAQALDAFANKIEPENQDELM